MSAPRVVLAVDISSSGVRARGHRADLTVASEVTVDLPPVQRADGASFHELDDVYSAVVSVVREASAGAEVAAIVASGTASSLVGYELRDGVPVAHTEAMLWSDLRALAWFDSLRPKLVEAYPRTLCPPDVSYWPAKLAMLGANGVAAPLYGGVKDAIFAGLTGHTWTDPMSAASSGVFDSAAWSWDEELLAITAANEAALPEVRAATAWAPLTAAASEQLGLPAGTPVVVGGMDGPLTQLGAAGGEHDIASCTVGTSIAFRTSSDERKIDPTLRTWCYPVEPDLWVSGGAGSNGGNLLTWLQAQLGFGSSVGEIVNAAFSVEPDSELLFVPSLFGERAPLWRTELRAALVGLGPHHDRASVSRAVVEGVAVCAIELAEAVRAVSGPLRTVSFTGGFLREPRWGQLLTDAIGTQTTVPTSETATSSGAAMVGWAALDSGKLSALPAPRSGPSALPRLVETVRLVALSKRTAAIRSTLWPE
ncbi:FGGY-family carbohydrate kinase [Leifsonia sp. Root227]|uniref:FGGY-family carbohydrate kinase n=1 Tax=Leifsonia sp. Root227 TaxID=1736496 RepID=UPI001EFF0DF1|nr:FGGY-family carbohydrate kinase [Leifsonia sp. Root227]